MQSCKYVFALYWNTHLLTIINPPEDSAMRVELELRVGYEKEISFYHRQRKKKSAIDHKIYNLYSL